MMEIMERFGFRSAKACHFFDSFQGTSKERIARKFQVTGANFLAFKPS